MRLPDPDAPVQGFRLLIFGGLGCLLFTILMAFGTYGLAAAWTRFHGAPPVSAPK